jgi:hypothetical protein
MTFKWDGKSRPSDNKYTVNVGMRYLVRKEDEELKESYEQSKLNKKERDDKEK